MIEQSMVDFISGRKNKIMKFMPDLFYDNWIDKTITDGDLPDFDLQIKNTNIVLCFSGVINKIRWYLYDETKELNYDKYTKIKFEQILERVSPEIKEQLIFNLDLFI